MSLRIALATLVLASMPLAGLADDSSANGSDVAVDKKSDNRSQNSKRDSSDIRRSRKDRQGAYEKHAQNRGKDKRQGGRNPSPDS